jgi:hypothetical protein
MRGWCAANHMKLNVDKSRVIVFTGITGSFNCDSRLCD